MIKQVMDFVFRLISQIFFGVHQSSTSPAFDLDAVVDRLNQIGDNLVERIQKMLIGLFVLGGLAILAVSVTTVRVFQLAARENIRILGLFEMDGALFFGVVLAFIAVCMSFWIVKRMSAPADPKTVHPRSTSSEPHTRTASPLEDALAALIHTYIDERAHRTPKETPSP